MIDTDALRDRILDTLEKEQERETGSPLLPDAAYDIATDLVATLTAADEDQGLSPRDVMPAWLAVCDRILVGCGFREAYTDRGEAIDALTAHRWERHGIRWEDDAADQDAADQDAADQDAADQDAADQDAAVH